MENLIKRSFKEKNTIILQTQWTKQCEIRDLKFVQKLLKKEQWFKKIWMSASKPQSRGATHRKKIVQRSEHIFEMTITKTKITEKKNYRSNTGHGGENGTYNNNSRQDNSINIIKFQQANSSHQSNGSAEIRDTIIEVLTSVDRRTWITETVIVLETQDNGRANCFLENSPFQQRRVIMNINIKIVKSTENNKKLLKL